MQRISATGHEKGSMSKHTKPPRAGAMAKTESMRRASCECRTWLSIQPSSHNLSRSLKRIDHIRERCGQGSGGSGLWAKTDSPLQTGVTLREHKDEENKRNEGAGRLSKAPSPLELRWSSRRPWRTTENGFRKDVHWVSTCRRSCFDFVCVWME